MPLASDFRLSYHGVDIWMSVVVPCYVQVGLSQSIRTCCDRPGEERSRPGRLHLSEVTPR